MAQQQAVRSRVNCPERLSLRSDDDVTNVSQARFYQFQNNLPTAILDPRRCQMIRMTIPNAQVQIPDHSLSFWYYRTTTDAIPANINDLSDNLYCVRLYPSWYVDSGGFAYTPTINQYVNDPQELVDLLNLASSVGGDDATRNPFWDADDITFSFDSDTNKISFVGNTASSYYTPAGYNDPNVLRAMRGQAYQGAITIDVQGVVRPQYFAPGYTLNLRLGYALSGQCPGMMGVSNANAWKLANFANAWFGTDVPILADSYPNLVYTSIIYVFANFITNSSLTSQNNHNLLAVVPVDSSSLGVTNYICATSNLLTKIASTIQDVIIEMRDEANEPYYLPDNASVSCEISFSYKEGVF